MINSVIISPAPVPDGFFLLFFYKRTHTHAHVHTRIRNYINTYIYGFFFQNCNLATLSGGGSLPGRLFGAGVNSRNYDGRWRATPSANGPSGVICARNRDRPDRLTLRPGGPSTRRPPPVSCEIPGKT